MSSRISRQLIIEKEGGETGVVPRHFLSWARFGPLLAIVAISVLCQAKSLDWPLMYTDDYVYENASSDSWRQMLNVYNVDLPRANIALGWWGSKGAAPVERRFVRYAPSLLLSAEAHMFGFRPLPYHVVTLALHVANCAILWALMLVWLQDRTKAWLTTVVLAAHPIAIGVVANMTWQAAAFAGTLMLLAVWAWVHYRRSGRWQLGAGATLLTFIAMTSYEVGVVLPVVIVIGDWFFARRASVRPRLVLLGLLPIYAVLYRAATHGILHSEVGPLRPLSYVWRTFRIDGANYVLKTLLVFDPHDMAGYWLFNRIGEPSSWLFLSLVLLPLLWWARKKPAALLGIVCWLILLAPPWLMRSTVHALSFPMLRQLYIPTFALALLVGAALQGAEVALRHWVLVGCVVAAEAVQALLSASLFDLRLAREAVGEEFVREVGAADSTLPLVVVNDQRRCSYNPRYDWPERDVLRPIPLAKDGKVELLRIDDHTLEARAKAGFDLPLTPQVLLPDLHSFGPGRGYVARTPPALVTLGAQQVDGAQLDVLERDAEALRRIRVRFERPLDSYVIVDVIACEHVERVDTARLARAGG